MEGYFKAVKSQSIAGRIYVFCVFEWKDELKKCGPFKWDNAVKLWYINKDDLTMDILNKTRIERKFKDQNPNNTKKYYYVRYLNIVDFREKCAKMGIDDEEYIKTLKETKNKVPDFRT